MHKKLFSALFAFILLISLAVPALANSPAPAWLTVYVNDAPEDMEIWLSFGNEAEIEEPARIIDNAYDFYSPSPSSSGAKLHVRTGDSEYTFFVTAQMCNNGALLTFDGGWPRLTAKASSLWVNIPVNVIVTLALEFAVLLMFRYRRGRTFIIFLLANLLTQAFWNAFIYWGIWRLEDLLDYAVPGSYLLEILLGEALVIVVEGLIYSRTFREHTPGRAWGYAITANMTSATIGTLTAALIKSWI